jgi:hypothetical protein
MKVKTFRILLISIAVLSIVILSAIAIKYFLFNEKDIEEKDDKVCMSVREYNKMNKSCAHVHMRETDSVASRDLKVVADPLYPPLNREDASNFNAVRKEVEQHNMYVSLNDINDSYRLLGYITYSEPEPIDKGGNSWQLFGRMKNRNNADFYIISTNNNYNMKIPLTPEIMNNKRFDLYNIPTEMQFNYPMLNRGIYNFLEIPKTDYSSSRYT